MFCCHILVKRKTLGLAGDYPALVLFNNFKAQHTTDILTMLDQNNINVEWYVQQVCEQHKEREHEFFSKAGH